MKIFAYILGALSYLVLGAHFMRSGENGLMVASIVLPLLLITKKKWILNIVVLVLAFASLEWFTTAYKLYQIRVAMQVPATRMLIIMCSVGIFTILSAALLYSNKVRNTYTAHKNDFAITSAFFLAISLMGIAFIKVKFPIVLAERFFPSFGWLEIILLSVYASFLTEKMSDPKNSPKYRRIIWTLFSVVFFTQLILGLLGFETFLMTGKLHLPIPAVILAGPIYRFQLSFMVFLFLGSIVLAGPAWCSHLCYFGVWDDYASRAKAKPDKLKKYIWHIRIGLFVLVVLSAWGMNLLGIPPLTAAIIGIAFGLIGVAVMIVWSRKLGFMSHCTLYCPIGLLAVIFGKISPFRIKITNECTLCMKCHYECRYNALNFEDIKNGKPNLNCTLCGDCISPCDHSSINYSFWKMKPENARMLFIVIITAMHAAFLGLGRI